MTINDPFRNHFKTNRLSRISKSIFDNRDQDHQGLINVEGKVLNIKHHGLFIELLLKDDATDLEIPIVSFETADSQVKVSSSLMCVGTIHFDWSPDLRCPTVSYPVAIKSNIIKEE